MKIKCNHCEQVINVKGLPHHLKTLHNTTYREYIKENLSQFPNWQICQNKECTNITPGTCCSRKCLAELKKTWTGEKSPRYGHKHSKQDRENIKKGQKNRIQISGEWREQRKGTTHSEVTKLKISKKMKGKLVGEKNGMYGKTHTPEAIKKIFSHRKMNSLEEKMSNLLDKLGIEYTFQFFLSRDGICKSYDFKITGRKILIETDGDYWHGNPNTTNHYKKVNEIKDNDIIKDKLAKDNGYKLIRFWGSDIDNKLDFMESELLSVLL
jgi:very-short-patch-repair endonuclease